MLLIGLAVGVDYSLFYLKREREERAAGNPPAPPGPDHPPQTLPVIQTYSRIQEAFPGGPAPAQVVVRADDVTSPAVAGAIRDLHDEALATRQMREPIQVDVNPAGTVAVASIPLPGKGAGAAGP